MPRGPQSARLIMRPEALQEFTASLDGVTRIAFDTESASFHRYTDRVYLIQVSTDSQTVIVDPLAIDDLSPIGRALADERVEVVFHDADYDLRTLDRDYTFRATHIFDTRVAAELAGEPAVGLDSLLEKYFQVRLNKKHQRADWSRRPLPDDMLAYAADDTRHLLPLRDKLEARLRDLGRLHWAREEFGLLEEVRWTGAAADDEQPFLRMKGAKALRGRALAVLEKLHTWRDETARRMDRAPFRIVGNDALLGVARAKPRSLQELLAVAELPNKLAHRHGRNLLQAVRAGLTTPADRIPRVTHPPRPARDPAYDARLERLKQLRNRRAREIGLDPGTVCPNGTLSAIAGKTPSSPTELDAIDELRRWQREVLNDREIIETANR